MLEYIPNDQFLFTAGAFVLGLALATIAGRRGSEPGSSRQDPRDARIRALEAELRIAKTDSVDSKSGLEKLEEEREEDNIGLERRDNVITEQQSKLEKVSSDLKNSVAQTHKLRAELAKRAEQGMHAEAKIREVETELSVAQASTDMIASGVLDYTSSPSGNPSADLGLTEDEPNDLSKAPR